MTFGNSKITYSVESSLEVREGICVFSVVVKTSSWIYVALRLYIWKYSGAKGTLVLYLRLTCALYPVSSRYVGATTATDSTPPPPKCQPLSLWMKQPYCHFLHFCSFITYHPLYLEGSLPNSYRSLEFLICSNHVKRGQGSSSVSNIKVYQISQQIEK